MRVSFIFPICECMRILFAKFIIKYPSGLENGIDSLNIQEYRGDTMQWYMCKHQVGINIGIKRV